MVRWLKKLSKETCLTWSHMHENSRWLNFKMAENIDHVSFCLGGSNFEKKLNPRNWMLRILSHLGFLAWKSEPSQQKTRDWDFEPLWIWAISISHANDITWEYRAYSFEIEMAQNLNHSFFLYFLFEIYITCLFAWMAPNSKRIWIREIECFEFWAISLFSLKKWAISAKNTWLRF